MEQDLCNNVRSRGRLRLLQSLLVLWAVSLPVAAQEPKANVDTVCRWQLVDRETGMPVRDAVVSINNELVRPPGEFPRTTIVARSEVKTDSRGHYEFAINPEGHASANHFLRIRILHPAYLARKFSVSAKSVLQARLEGARLPEEVTRLDAGVEVLGTAFLPDGTPAAHVDYVGYSLAGAPTKPVFDRTTNLQGTTDELGRFRVVVAPVGYGVICLQPKENAPSSIGFSGVPDNRQFPDIHLQKGIRIQGRVLDFTGEPVRNMQVTAQRISAESSDVTAAIGKSRLPSLIVRTSTTDHDGHYAFEPLPVGEYEFMIRSDFDAQQAPVYEGYFVKERRELTAENHSTDFRAKRAARIRLTTVDSDGKTATAVVATVMGRYRGGSVFASGVRQPDESQVITVPFGLEDANLILSREEPVAVRLMPGQTSMFVSGQYPLGTIEADLNQIEVTRFRPTTVTITVTDEENKILDDAVPTGAMKLPESNKQITITFQKATNGQWKSAPLVPNTPLEIQVAKTGWNAKNQVLTVKEGESRAITVVMKKMN